MVFVLGDCKTCEASTKRPFIIAEIGAARHIFIKAVERKKRSLNTARATELEITSMSTHWNCFIPRVFCSNLRSVLHKREQ